MLHLLAEIDLSPNVHTTDLGEMLGVEATASRQAKTAKLHRFLKRLAEDIDLFKKISTTLGKPASFFLFSDQNEVSQEFESMIHSRLERIEHHLSQINHVREKPSRKK